MPPKPVRVKTEASDDIKPIKADLDNADRKEFVAEQLDGYKDAFAARDKKLVDLQRQCYALADEKSVSDLTIISLQGVRDRLQEVLEKTKKEKKEFSESCADWKECYTEQEACTKSALEQISVLEKRVKDLETSNQKFKKLAAASKTELADSKAEVSKVKIAEAKEVEKLNVSINKLVKSKTNEAAEFSRKEAAHQATIEAMKIEHASRVERIKRNLKKKLEGVNRLASELDLER